MGLLCYFSTSHSNSRESLKKSDHRPEAFEPPKTSSNGRSECNRTIKNNFDDLASFPPDDEPTINSVPEQRGYLNLDYYA